MTIVSDEDHLPYDRPLSKEVLRAETDDVTLKPAEFYDENDITVLLGNGARSVDTAAQTPDARRRHRAAYDELIIATGSVPKRIRRSRTSTGSTCCGTSTRVSALRKEAGRPARGRRRAGFIGCEVAASLRGDGRQCRSRRAATVAAASVLGGRSASWWPVAPRRGRRRPLRCRSYGSDGPSG